MTILKKIASRLRTELADYWQVLLILPALSGYVYSNDINLIAQQSLVYRKICLHEFSLKICDSPESNSTVSNRVHELTSTMQIYLNIAFMAPAILSIVHLFSLADRHLNYELPLIVSLVGSLIQTVMCVFAVYADYATSIGLLLGSQFANGICGAGSLAFISACFSHVANYENKKDSSTNSPYNSSVSINLS